MLKLTESVFIDAWATALFTRLAMPLGMMVGGLVSNSISPVAVFAIAAVSKGVEVSIALLSPIRKL